MPTYRPDSLLSGQSRAFPGSWHPVPVDVVAVPGNRSPRPQEPGTRFPGTASQFPRTAWQFRGSGRDDEYVQVSGWMGATRSYACHLTADGGRGLLAYPVAPAHRDFAALPRPRPRPGSAAPVLEYDSAPVRTGTTESPPRRGRSRGIRRACVSGDPPLTPATLFRLSGGSGPVRRRGTGPSCPWPSGRSGGSGRGTHLGRCRTSPGV